MNEEMNYLKEKQKMSIALIASCAVEVLALLGVAFGVFEETAFYLTEIIAVIANLGLIVIPDRGVALDTAALFMRHKRYQTKRCIEEDAFYRNCAGRFVHLLLCFCVFTGVPFYERDSGRITKNCRGWEILCHGRRAEDSVK